MNAFLRLSGRPQTGNPRHSFGRFSALLFAVLLLPVCRAEKIVLRLGYFPNVTHAQGVIGAHSTRENKGWFEQRLGADVTILWFPYNAGPAAMEAIFADSIDATYVGPNPALNAYIRSEGQEIRLLAGAAQGGAALVVPAGAKYEKAEDFRGKRIATPQLGNTQDVAARAWFKAQGLRVTLTGGDVFILPTPNPDQLGLFQTGKIDGAWTVEPWVSRLVLEGGGRVYLEEKDAVTTIFVSSVKLLKNQPALAAKLKAAHLELTAWINAHPAEAQEQVRVALSAETKREISAKLVGAAWTRLTFTDAVDAKALEKFVADAKAANLLKASLPLDRLLSGQP